VFERADLSIKYGFFIDVFLFEVADQ